jgi:hypothetical protein
MTAPSGVGNLPLPRWAYVPGVSEKSGADYETLSQVAVLVPPRFGGYVPARHPALRYGLTLNDRGYFWEAQEILEAVWAAAPQGGRERGAGDAKRRRRLCRLVSGRGAGGPHQGQAGAASARQGRLRGVRGRRPNMKQNACSCVLG